MWQLVHLLANILPTLFAIVLSVPATPNTAVDEAEELADDLTMILA